jgi:hypothetical protein
VITLAATTPHAQAASGGFGVVGVLCFFLGGMVAGLMWAARQK